MTEAILAMKQTARAGQCELVEQEKREGVRMQVKEILKKCFWIITVVLVSFLMIRKGQTASENVWIEKAHYYITVEDLWVEEVTTFRYYGALLWEILKGIAVLVPVWLMTLLGLGRSFLGENWFPFAQKISVRVTKIILIAAAVLLAGISVAAAVYAEYTEDIYQIRYAIENKFDRWKSVSGWVLFYSVLLYIEQWCNGRNDSRQNIRKKQMWVVVTTGLTLLILLELRGVELWYVPLNHVDSPNTLEDYTLWWFALYMAVSSFPVWFLAARKTIRLFKKVHWLTLSNVIPGKITGLAALALTGLMVWEIQEYRSCIAWLPNSEVPEYTEARAMGHLFPALMCALALFYTICLLIKQIWITYKQGKSCNMEESAKKAE